jgi:hypothetical protein
VGVSVKATTVSMSPVFHAQRSCLCVSISRNRQLTTPSHPGCGSARNVNSAPGSSSSPATGRSHWVSRAGSVSARHTFAGG